MTARCGTCRGYYDHRRAGTVPCKRCVAAIREYIAWRAFRNGKQERPRSCPACGSVFPDHTCTMGQAPRPPVPARIRLTTDA